MKKRIALFLILPLASQAALSDSDITGTIGYDGECQTYAKRYVKSEWRPTHYSYKGDADCGAHLSGKDYRMCVIAGDPKEAGYSHCEVVQTTHTLFLYWKARKSEDTHLACKFICLTQFKK